MRQPCASSNVPIRDGVSEVVGKKTKMQRSTRPLLCLSSRERESRVLTSITYVCFRTHATCGGVSARRLSKFENIHGLVLSKFESEMPRTAPGELIWCPYIILGRRGLNNRHSLSLSLFFVFFPAYTIAPRVRGCCRTNC
jgi:hypothetical protein